MSRRPSIWHYMSFSSPSSRYSNRTELPLRGPEEDDMFEKPERRSGMYSPPSYANGYRKPAWSTAGSKSGYLKVGGAVAMILLVLYVLMSGETARGKLEKGRLNKEYVDKPAWLTVAQEKLQSQIPRRQQQQLLVRPRRRNAQNLMTPQNL